MRWPIARELFFFFLLLLLLLRRRRHVGRSGISRHRKSLCQRLKEPAQHHAFHTIYFSQHGSAALAHG